MPSHDVGARHRPSQVCEAAISTHGCDGRTIVGPASCRRASATRTSTSVIVNCSPTNSMRLPASPFGPASIQRRSTSESASSWTMGSFRFLHAVRQLQHDRQAHAREHRRAPQHAELAGRGLLDLEIGGTRLVGAAPTRGRARQRAHRQRRPEAPATCRQRCSLWRSVAVQTRHCCAGGGAGRARRRASGGAGSSTVYFARISS